MPRPRSDNPTPGELEVLQILWDRGESTVRDVMESLAESRPRAYTSVMSLLNVMVDKGLLRRRSEGRAFVYWPRVERASTLRRMVADLRERAFGGSTEQLVLHVIEQSHPTPRELEQIRLLIDAYRQNREEPS